MMIDEIEEDEENLEEISSMAGGSVQGYSLPLGAKKKKVKKQKEMIEEMILREIIYEMLKRKHIKEQKENDLKLRGIIKRLIAEAKKDIEDSPHSSTAINLLEDLLKSILPNLETQYKSLTTNKAQRDSFRAHVVNAVSELLETEDLNRDSSLSQEADGETLEEQEVEEEVNIKVSDVDASAEDKFIDIEAEPEEVEEPDTFSIAGQDETGRAMAQEAYNDIEKNITDTYAILHDETDQKLFRDYLITNLKMYFDKYEKELGAVIEPTTDEYEAEKQADETEAAAELGTEVDTELGMGVGDIPAEEPAV
jgi:ribosomal protein L17